MDRLESAMRSDVQNTKKTPAEFARMRGVSVSTIYRALSHGALTAVYDKGRWTIFTTGMLTEVYWPTPRARRNTE